MYALWHLGELGALAAKTYFFAFVVAVESGVSPTNFSLTCSEVVFKL